MGGGFIGEIRRNIVAVDTYEADGTRGVCMAQPHRYAGRGQAAMTPWQNLTYNQFPGFCL